MQRLQSGSCSTQRELQVGEQHEYFKGETQPRVVQHGGGWWGGHKGPLGVALKPWTGLKEVLCLFRGIINMGLKMTS